MNKNKRKATWAVLLFTGGALTLSSFAVPGLVNSAVVAKDRPEEQTGSLLDLTGKSGPVLKVEAPAPVSTVNEELVERMTEEQIRQITDALDKLSRDPRISGRDITEAEVNRRLVLEDGYVYDGLRPKELLPLVPGQAEFYLDLDNNIYTYPERTMTDEELLQLIDWSYRLNYVLSSRSVTAPPVAQNISKTEAEELAAESVNKLFEGDVSKLEATVLLVELGQDKRPTWTVHFAPYRAQTLRGQGESCWEYNVFIDAKSGVVEDTTAFNPSLKRTPIDEAAARSIRKDDSWIQEAIRIVQDQQRETKAVVKASLTEVETNNKRGMVAVELLLEDGSSYTAELRYPDQSLRCLIYKSIIPSS
ncbi:hypothetical protein [Paenibacillus tengchongensis]|uniref:hypothetical protein n=1 Tax=Paenibacillus tengchongensis TaxID=2608684 RepID=UPI00124CDDC3|nr:hypothetical protein [Paenibacillus tengchongensis]